MFYLCARKAAGLNKITWGASVYPFHKRRVFCFRYVRGLNGDCIGFCRRMRRSPVSEFICCELMGIAKDIEVTV